MPWWVLLILGLRVPSPSICVVSTDPRNESTHLIMLTFLSGYSWSLDWECLPYSKVCWGIPDLGTEITHVVEPRSMHVLDLVGTPDPKTESTHPWYMCGYSWFQDWEYPRDWIKYMSWWVLLILGLRVPTPGIRVGTPHPRAESTHP